MFKKECICVFILTKITKTYIKGKKKAVEKYYGYSLKVVKQKLRLAFTFQRKHLLKLKLKWR